MPRYKVRIIVEVECMNAAEAEWWMRDKMKDMEWSSHVGWPTYVVGEDEPMNKEGE